jgi:hypothetical protein
MMAAVVDVAARAICNLYYLWLKSRIPGGVCGSFTLLRLGSQREHAPLERHQERNSVTLAGTTGMQKADEAAQ